MKKCLLMCMGLLLTGTALANTAKPVMLSCPRPTFPMEAAVKRMDGSVQYRLTVNEKGAVESVSVSGDEVFFKVVKGAVRKCTFEPGKPGVYEGTAKFIVQ